MTRIYATLAQLTGHLKPDPPPVNGGRLLARASCRVARAVLCAVYDVDAAGLPTDTDVAEALRDATLEQISYWLTNGDEEGIGVTYSQVKIGSVQLQRSGNGAGGQAGGLCAAATDVLTAAGLTGQAPRTYC